MGGGGGGGGSCGSWATYGPVKAATDIARATTRVAVNVERTILRVGEGGYGGGGELASEAGRRAGARAAPPDPFGSVELGLPTLPKVTSRRHHSEADSDRALSRRSGGERTAPAWPRQTPAGGKGALALT